MALRVRITPIERSAALALRAGEDPRQRAARLAGFARDRLAEAQEQNRQALGAVPPHETFVDGRRGAALESVSPNGTIVFEFDLASDLFAYIDLLLITHAPVRRGQFRRSFVLLADGVEVDPQAARLPDAQEYVYVNTQPYARKIERGLSPQAPDGVFEAVATLAARRLGNLARIRFGFRSLTGGAVADWAARTNMKAGKRKGFRRRDWLTRQPAIIITK